MQKARIFISIIIICLIVSACASLSKSSIDVVGNTLHKRSNTSSEKENRVSDLKPVKYPQRKEKLPGIDTLTTFPGIFENMFLTLEQIITVLGNDFELRENLAQGYDTYIYNKYDMAIEFDRLRHKPSAIYLSGTPYYFNSGASEKKDLNGDGIPECIIIYEDVNYSGKILLVDGKTGKQCEKEFGYLGNKSSVEILTGLGEYKESVILIKTHGGKLADLFKYENENLIRILPDEYSRRAENTSVTVEANKAVVVNKNEDFLYLCPLPDRFSSFVK
ncbi:MAG: hypothetical protein GX957_14295, partial [Clostridiaceae bacterium]|nr:hypothetical protein [Clostridiaceae bacterium]